MGMLKNGTKKTVIMESVKKAQGFSGMLRGLMFRSKKSVDYALVFEFPFEGRYTTSVHMFFVFFSIDILFVNAKKQVVDIRRNVLPFTPSIVPRKPAQYFIEVPAGKAKSVAVGDVLEWNY
jgi:uncharacterized protein